MPFCASCGSPVEGNFCPKCGAAMNPAAQPAAGAPPPGPQSPAAAPMETNVASALCYVLWILTGIVFLVLEPYSKNRTVRFHAFQSIFMSVALFVINLVITIPFGAFGWGYGFWSLYGLHRLFELACFALWLWMIIAAYQGKTVVLPIIGQIAQKQAQS